jgi:hypothetical protein
MNDKLRLLVLDDKTTFPSVRIKGLISFENEPREHQALYERNFELSWQFDIKQTLELHNRIVVALETRPSELLTVTRYPNILWMDYKFDKSALTASDLRDNPAAAALYARNLDPLRGDWGRDYRDLGLSDAHWEAFSSIASSDLPEYPGVEAGLRIFDRLRDYACFPIAQTGHIDPPQTRLQERFAMIDVGESIRQKYGVLGSWYEFLSKALPLFRDRLVLTARRGTMAPRLVDLAGAAGAREGLDPDHVIHWQSALGTEAFRLEALFFDQFYEYDRLTNRLTRRAPHAVRAAFDAWATRVIAAAAGPRATGAISLALQLADRFRAAHASTEHLTRRALSRQLGDVIVQEDRRIMAVRAAHKDEAEGLGLKTPTLVRKILDGTIEQAGLSEVFVEGLRAARALTVGEAELAADQNAALLDDYGFTPQAIAQALIDRSIYDLTLAPQLRASHGVLGQLTAEANGDPLVTRYAALTLMVYAELAWIARQVGDTAALRDVLANLDDPEVCRLREPLGEVERLAAPILGERAARELRRSVDRDGKIPLEIFNRFLLSEMLGERSDLDRSACDIVAESEKMLERAKPGGGKPGAAANVITEADQKFALVMDLLSPTPKQLLLWRDRGRDADQTIYRPLERQKQSPLDIRAILEGSLNGIGGLEIGEGRIVSVIAAHLQFDRLYWPVWMRMAEKGGGG